MTRRYDLARLYREIAEDETVCQPANETLSQADINRMVKARRKKASAPPAGAAPHERGPA